MNNIVIRFFNATWCGPCKQMKPHLDELKKAGYPIEYIDVDENPTLAESANVRGVPTTAIYENDTLVERVVGYEDKDRLKKRIQIYFNPNES
jgi:thiol-disulfide isomerase/thioredoxin